MRGGPFSPRDLFPELPDQAGLMAVSEDIAWKLGILRPLLKF